MKLPFLEFKVAFSFITAVDTRVPSDNDTKSKIPELGMGTSQKNNVTLNLMPTNHENEDEAETSFPISFSNAPLSTWTLH